MTKAPGIYAPYQPRFDWNLWFASLGSWTRYPLVPRTEETLLINDPDVLVIVCRQSISRPVLRAWCAPCFGSIGLPAWRKSGRREPGGVGNCWAHMLLPWRLGRMAKLAWCGRKGLRKRQRLR